MTKRIKAKKKVSRKLGVNLWGDDKSPFNKRPSKPGQHGNNIRGRVTVYGKQLQAKQMLKFYYGNISEKQFRNIFNLALRIKGNVADNFVGLLESRLDMVIYRANFVPTIFAARQFVNHKHILVNGKVINIASYRLKIGDIIEVKDKSKNINLVLESLSDLKRDLPEYLSLDSDKKIVKVTGKANTQNIPYPVNMNINSIIEFYSS